MASPQTPALGPLCLRFGLYYALALFAGEPIIELVFSESSPSLPTILVGVVTYLLLVKGAPEGSVPVGWKRRAVLSTAFGLIASVLQAVALTGAIVSGTIRELSPFWWTVVIAMTVSSNILIAFGVMQSTDTRTSEVYPAAEPTS